MSVLLTRRPARENYYVIIILHPYYVQAFCRRPTPQKRHNKTFYRRVVYFNVHGKKGKIVIPVGSTSTYIYYCYK